MTSVVKILILNDQKLYYTLKVGSDKKNTLCNIRCIISFQLMMGWELDSFIGDGNDGNISDGRRAL